MTPVTELYGEREEQPERALPLSFADLEADALVTSLAGLAKRVEQNQAARRAAEAELAELRDRLERERERRQALRTRLIDLLRDLDD